MWSQWPSASLAIMDRFETQLEAWGGTIPNDELEADALPRLLDEAELGAAAGARTDDDLSSLRKLLAIEGCGLSWDEIRRIRRYTVNFHPAIEERVHAEASPTVRATPT